MEPPNKVIRLSSEPRVYLPSPDEVITEKDLPLLANIEDVRVHHYLMKLSTNFSKKVVTGSVVLFLEWLKPSQRKIVLDQCFLQIKRVVLMKTGAEYDAVKNLAEFSNGTGNRNQFYGERDWFQESEKLLEFTQSKWSVTIEGWKEGRPPSVIRIDYETLETTPSLHWRPCDGFSYHGTSSKCCYTPAAALNNRGLFPCQEPPSAMATWEVLLECELEYTPLLTSDQVGEIVEGGQNGYMIHYFCCSVPLPMSTFAMVIGKFYFQTDLITRAQINGNLSNPVKVEHVPTSPCQHHSKYPCRFGNVSERQQKLIPVRLFCLDPDTVPTDCKKFTNLVSSSLETSFAHFGPHPFSRQDIVIVPKSYPHEGLTSPSMIFLAPNNFYGNEPLYVCQLPHEICHNWFGLLIGSLNSSEEWLSEGFATYCEDVLFPISFQVNFPARTVQDVECEQALKMLMRFTSLQTELKNTETDNDLHVMSNGNTQTGAMATNGLVPLKQFMSVHYYKGYLLLFHLASLVGQPDFLKFLKEYVRRYHGQLVTSEMFLECYHSRFKEILPNRDAPSFMTNVKNEWLQSNKLPEPYNSLDFMGGTPSEDSVPPLFLNALEPLRKVKDIFNKLLESTEFDYKLETLSSSELHLLANLILNGLSDPQKFKPLEKNYFRHLVTSEVFQDIEQRHNAELAHRWCELIISFKDKARLPLVEKFLRNNIAMGVYLYGELMITERYTFQKLAKQVYYELENVYDLNTKKILKEMLF